MSNDGLLPLFKNVLKIMRSPTTKHHTLMEMLLKLNESIEAQLHTLDGSQHVHDQLELPLHDFSNLSLAFMQNDVLHRVRNNIVASISSILFITECRLRLLLNDADWCDLDQYFRSKSQFFSKEQLFDYALYATQDIPFFNTHPLVQYTMLQCEQTLNAVLHSKHRYTSIEELDFVVNLFHAVRDRIAIIVNYPCTVNTNNIPRYVVRIGNDRAVCTSAFVYDFSVIVREVQRRIKCFETAAQLKNSAELYEPFINETHTSFIHWCGDMVITAAGDDFCDLFTKYFLDLQIHDFERDIYLRMFPQTGTIVAYKLLQSIRSGDVANSFMLTGQSFISDLLKKQQQNEDDEDEEEPDDSMCTVAEIVLRMECLDEQMLDTLFMALLDYVLVRQWERDLKSFMAYDFSCDVEEEPRLLWVPFQRMYYVLTITQEVLAFPRFVHAFAVLCYHLQKSYNGVFFHPTTRERVVCSELIQNMFGLKV